MIRIVGIGIDGRDGLSKRALSAIEGADVLIGGRRHLEIFDDFEGERIPIGSDLEGLARAIEERLDLSIVVLATGDPCFFGIGRFLLKRFGKEGVEIIPNVTVMQEAFARIKETWEDVRFMSLHGREDLEAVVDEICRCEKVGIFTDGRNTPQMIAKALIERGAPPFRVYVCEEMGTANERVREGGLEDIARMETSPLNVMILFREADDTGPLLGIPEDDFSHRGGMITKEEVRSIVIGKLRLRKDSIVWDVGAGSGSVGIEAARVARRVYAVEKDRDAISIIGENRREFGVYNLMIVKGKAPEILKGLPTPDAVFIGGSGGELEGILGYCLERIRKGGRVVANFATLENLSKAMDLVKERGLTFQVVEVSIKRGEGIGRMTRLKALDPVFILTVEV